MKLGVVVCDTRTGFKTPPVRRARGSSKRCDGNLEMAAGLIVCDSSAADLMASLSFLEMS